MCKHKRVRITLLSSKLLFCVMLVDEIVVHMESSLFFDEGFLFMYLLIIPGHEMEEGLILANCPSSHDTCAN